MNGSRLPLFRDGKSFGAEWPSRARQVLGLLVPAFGILKESVQRAAGLVVVLWVLQSSLLLAHAAQTFGVVLNGLPYPELLTINQGDTVTFQFSETGSTECYTGEWSTPILQAGQTFSFTFTRPGTYVYRVSSGVPPTYDNVFFPGLVKVQALDGAPPPIWIARPLDHFIVAGYTEMEAATTNSAQSVVAVNFYVDGQLFGTVTNPPYLVNPAFPPGTHQFTASVVDTLGRTNISAPISVTFGEINPQLFWPGRLPQGQTVIFESAAGGPFCLYWSGDLATWSRQVLGQSIGRSIIVDETTTNVTQRFYYLKQCL